MDHNVHNHIRISPARSDKDQGSALREALKSKWTFYLGCIWYLFMFSILDFPQCLCDWRNLGMDFFILVIVGLSVISFSFQDIFCIWSTIAKFEKFIPRLEFSGKTKKPRNINHAQQALDNSQIKVAGLDISIACSWCIFDSSEDSRAGSIYAMVEVLILWFNAQSKTWKYIQVSKRQLAGEASLLHHLTDHRNLKNILKNKIYLQKDNSNTSLER